MLQAYISSDLLDCHSHSHSQVGAAGAGRAIAREWSWCACVCARARRGGGLPRLCTVRLVTVRRPGASLSALDLPASLGAARWSLLITSPKQVAAARFHAGALVCRLVCHCPVSSNSRISPAPPFPASPGNSL